MRHLSLENSKMKFSASSTHLNRFVLEECVQKSLNYQKALAHTKQRLFIFQRDGATQPAEICLLATSLTLCSGPKAQSDAAAAVAS